MKVQGEKVERRGMDAVTNLFRARDISDENFREINFYHLQWKCAVRKVRGVKWEH